MEGDGNLPGQAREERDRYEYSRRLTVPAQGSFAVRALHYRARRLVATSALTPFALAQRIDIDSMVNGWMEPADTLASADKPLDIVFSTPSDWVSLAALPRTSSGVTSSRWAPAA